MNTTTNPIGRKYSDGIHAVTGSGNAPSVGDRYVWGGKLRIVKKYDALTNYVWFTDGTSARFSARMEAI